MGNITEKYRLSIYSEVVELSKGKVYIVTNSLDDKVYIKKVLERQNYKIYEKMKNLSISNIPKIYEIIILDEKLIVIEEYINGSSLKEILDESKTIDEAKVIQYTLELINILEELHSLDFSIIHKDIKPSNIMINNDGILKLIDFDISRTYKNNKSKDTHILGTYGYASPEQFGFNQTDPRTDIFSLGVTMNMMLVGELPGDELYKGDLSKVISKCIELDPDKRFQNVGELKDELLKKQRKYHRKKEKYSSSKLPGFRSNNIFFKIIAFLWYSLLTMIILGFFGVEAFSSDRISDIVLGTFFLLVTFLYGNFKNIKSKLPLLNSKNILIRILAHFLYGLLLFIIAGMFLPREV